MSASLQALLWGLVSGSALVIGTATGYFTHLSQRLVAGGVVSITVAGFLASFVLSKLG